MIFMVAAIASSMYIIGILVSEDKSTRIFFCRLALSRKIELDFGIFFVNGHTEKKKIDDPHIQR
jgi:hypothetical protein